MEIREQVVNNGHLQIHKVGKTGELGAGYKLVILTEIEESSKPTAYESFFSSGRRGPDFNIEERFFTDILELVVFLIHWFESETHVAEVLDELRREESDHMLDAVQYMRQEDTPYYTPFSALHKALKRGDKK